MAVNFFRGAVIGTAISCILWGVILLGVCRAAVIEGAYEGCSFIWRDFANNGGYWLTGNNLYIVAHGSYANIYPGCGQPNMTPEDISPEYDFMFVAVCEGMNETGPGTFSGRAMESVGYQHLSESYCDSCWNHALSFQDYLFRRHAAGAPWSIAYDQTIEVFPECQACTKYFNRTADIVQKVLLPHLLR